MKKIDRFLLFIILLFFSFSIGKVKGEDLSDFYKSMNASNFGTEFYITIPPCNLEDDGGQNYIKLVLLSYADAKVKVSGKDSWSAEADLKAFETGEIVFAPEYGQVYQKRGKDPVPFTEVHKKSALHLVSSDPVAVFVIVKFNKSGDGFTALPVSALSNRYVIRSYTESSAYYPGYSFPSMAAVVGVYDMTEVKFIVGGNDKTTMSIESSINSGDTISFTLNSGDVWLGSTISREADLSGSRVESNFPVSVISGNQCANIPYDNKWCDYIAEAETPENTWGKSFIVPTVEGRKQSPIIRVFAKETDTKVYIDGVLFKDLPNDSGTIDRSYFETRINSGGAPQGAVISADKPIAVTLYNTGVAEDGDPMPLGDPFQMSLTPVEQFLSAALFSTSSKPRPTLYPEKYLTITTKTENGSIPAGLQIAYISKGVFAWQNASAMNPKVNLLGTPLNGSQYMQLVFPLLKEGAYAIKGAEFAAYTYGLSDQTAYGYQACFGTKVLGTDDSIPPVPSWNVDCRGNVTGVVIDMPVDAEKANLAAPIYFSNESFNYNPIFGKLLIGSADVQYWYLTIRDANKPAKGVIKFRDKAGNDTTVTITYVPRTVAFSLKDIDFGNLRPGEYVDTTVMVYNRSSEPYFLKNLNVKLNKYFSILETISPTLIAPNDSMKITIRFNPLVSGDYKDSLGVGDTCIFSYKTFLSGRCGNPIIWVQDVTFGEITIGREAVVRGIIRNNGKTSLALTGFTQAAEPKIIFEPDELMSQASPYILKTQSELGFTVRYTPDATYYLNDQIILHSNAAEIDSICQITGRSVVPGLTVSSNNWGKCRINRTEFPVSPYLPSMGGLLIENSSSLPVTVNTAVFENNTGGEYSADLTKLDGKVFVSGEKYYFPVEFLPQTPGHFNALLKITDSEGRVATSDLSGTGIVPSTTTTNIYFGECVINNTNQIKSKLAELKNLNETDWEFADTLTVFGIESKPQVNSIGLYNEFGEEGFKFDSTQFIFPIKVLPGESLEGVAEFLAKKEGLASANLTFITDAFINSSSEFTGQGNSRAFSISAGSGSACPGMSDTITVKIKNNSNAVLPITKLEFESSSAYFNFESPADASGFDIKPDSVRTIILRFNSVLPGEVRNGIVFFSEDNLPLDTIEVSGETVQIERQSDMMPVQQTSAPGKIVTTKIMLNGSGDINFAAIKKLSFKGVYDDYQISPRLDMFEAGLTSAGKFRVENTWENPLKKEFGFDLVSVSGENFNINGEIARMAFNTFLPASNNDYSSINMSITGEGNNCVKFNNSTSRIAVKADCASEIRKVLISGTNYELKEISPNPVSNHSAKISFSLGLNAQTEISLINSNGETVLVPVNSYMESGSYETDLDISNIASGIYFCKLVSGPFTEIKKLIIIK